MLFFLLFVFSSCVAVVGRALETSLLARFIAASLTQTLPHPECAVVFSHSCGQYSSRLLFVPFAQGLNYHLDREITAAAAAAVG